MCVYIIVFEMYYALEKLLSEKISMFCSKYLKVANRIAIKHSD